MVLAAIALGLALIGTPLFAVIGFAGMVSFHNAEIDGSAIFVELYRIASNPTLLAIPLFTFAGFVLAEGKTPQRLNRLSQALFGGFRGGVPLAVLLVCALFSSFTGASGVTIIALGGLLFPLLIKETGSKKFSLGLITTSGSLGLLFPPSLPLILYGLIAQVSVDRLFLAGIIPGFIAIIAVYLYSYIRGGQKSNWDFDKREAVSALKGSGWEIPLPFIIMGGIYSGTVTVTEAATLTAAYTLFIQIIINKEIQLVNDVPRLIRESMILTGSILIILGTALGFTSYLVDEQIPMQILSFMQVYIHDKWTFLLVLNIFLLIVGCMMDIFSAIVVVVPLIIPIAKSFDINMIHLGIIFLMNLEIGFSTPPIGMNLFISSSRFEEPVTTLYASIWPFLGIHFIVLMLVTFIPQISLFLTTIF
jgi:C4-dicarboxylate transporter DctM subunit